MHPIVDHIRKSLKAAADPAKAGEMQRYMKTILKLAPEKEFFIRKAIGWILRDYSYTDPQWVERFVEENQDTLSGLSKREALKHIRRKQR